MANLTAAQQRQFYLTHYPDPLQYPNQPPLTQDQLCTLDTCPASRSLFNYQPRLDYNLALVGLFSISLIAHCVSGWRYRTWGFMSAMLTGSVLEIAGYAARIVAHNNPFPHKYFLVQICLLTLAPVFYSAGIYICFSRIVRVYSTSLSRLQPQWYTRIFITVDVIALILQGSGGAISSVFASRNQTVSTRGLHVMQTGLSFQVLTLLCFSALGIEFGIRCWRHQEELNPASRAWRHKRRFRGFLMTECAAVLLIVARSCYRLAELSDGYKGKLAGKQNLFFVFEGCFIILTVYLFNTFHPGYSFGPYFAADSPEKGHELSSVASQGGLARNMEEA